MKKTLQIIFKGLAGIIGLILLYVILAVTIPLIPVPKKATTEIAEVPIYIYTNGVHTDIVLPIKNNQIDWSNKILFDNTLSKSSDFNYVGIGWGDKGFYLDTPTWAELKVSTAFYAAFWLGDSAMHCTFYKTMKEGEDCKKILLTRSQYADLIKFVDSKFDKNSAGQNILIPTNAVYSNDDAFYEAKGSYSFLYTCNTWTNDALKTAGQKAALWTPTDFGIFQHYK
ncbi:MULTISPECIES: TIGR02117 family protein [unclassified Kaistella]|uniref:TIGR02117 family protein n=1 Tax=unclassified Kaistella TaxID=2762626 RepID=UPI002736A0E7|nr:MULTISPECIES: TIGR02117 family protein [unclassified Kaistella]MDP2454075.1 TIGR02117 family protein [Kaistella sp. SH11-4b]MDP2457132.1 TIGR02117 family protein [Kaistella sp. SH40-3]MDP2459890.1 TIGR02117 family protein [Kaistella sp. SH19-2b]